MRKKWRRWALASLAGATAIVMGACGSDTGGPTRTLSGTVNETAFVVGPNERVACRGDVTVNCETAEITGRLYSQAGGTAGAAGGNLVIAATGTISVTGQIATGAGAAGAAGAAGGQGGNLRLSATQGITLGAAAGRQTGGPLLQTGSGGNGSASTTGLGGGGGDGGDLLLQCPGGTLTLHAAAGLIALGNGGNGGSGVGRVTADTTRTVLAGETNRGGDSGNVLVSAQAVVGAETGEAAAPADSGLTGPVGIIYLPAGTLTGGVGGNAGALEVSMSAPAARQSAESPAPRQREQSHLVFDRVGAPGGWGLLEGGVGEDIRHTWPSPLPDETPLEAEERDNGTPAFDVNITGGRGADSGTRLNPDLPAGSEAAQVMVNLGGEYAGGRGGNVEAHGKWGRHGAPGTKAGTGGTNTSHGGAGGDVYLPEFPEEGPATPRPGHGGSAIAIGGPGGLPGNGCTVSPQLPGGDGGDGGDCHTFGGDGGWTKGIDGAARDGQPRGTGGLAQAQAGSARFGGDGTTAGQAGSRGTATAVVGTGVAPGDQAPEAVVEPGNTALPGNLCAGATRQRLFRTLRGGFNYVRPWTVLTETLASSRQAGTALGGATHPISVFPGQSMALNTARTILWISSAGKLRRYNDPLTGGDRAPLWELDPPAFVSYSSLAYANSRDTLYASVGGHVVYWRSAAAMTTARQPDGDWVIDGTYCDTLCYDDSNDRIFALGNNDLVVVNSPSTKTGTIAATSRLLLSAVTSASFASARGLACDSGGSLYFGVANHGSGDALTHEVRAVPLPPWPATPTVRVIGGLDGQVEGLLALSRDDILMVGTRGSNYVYRNASQRDTGNSAPSATSTGTPIGWVGWTEIQDVPATR
ncbi:MAG: hypothetical protein HZB16_06120 [Armatimonadetes bacterium]|nr:hypothetical protein [Armatimonadota bacterium]